MYSWSYLITCLIIFLEKTCSRDISSSLSINRTLLQPRNVSVKSYGHDFIVLTWEHALAHDILTIYEATIQYQIWHWPVNASLELIMASTYSNSYTIMDLKPGQTYSIWVLGITDNITSDYVTLLQSTGK